MADRYNLISPRPRKDGKTHWHTIGSAFPRDKGGFSLIFDSLPLPDAEGRVTVLMTEPLPKDGQQQRGGSSGYGQSGGYGGGAGGGMQGRDLDDSIPF
ncbi:hypothetical protein [Paracoccus sulfuroxidans]|uniref:Uncharacterized protein n=1 Tax=Paracoccus sulfuroxidans TaxID=384678 RepID=A0A562NKN8_9RHOB|nr:hypothetical protein [Paracoccus sulfuroxidans]TWI32779.1 hypothetical protein IQ24_02654 [Paracoccus sulfuroxidans]